MPRLGKQGQLHEYDLRHATPHKHAMKSEKKDGIVTTTEEPYPWSSVRDIQ